MKSKLFLPHQIKPARKRLKLTQSDLAEMAGLVPSAISYIERGKRWPRPNTLVKLTNALCRAAERKRVILEFPELREIKSVKALEEIKYDSKYVLISRKPISEDYAAAIMQAWDDFITAEGTILLLLDGTKIRFMQVKET